MESILIIRGLLICGFVSIVLIIRRLRSGKDRFPPGPFAWPVIGHLHLFSNLPHQALAQVAKKYGPIVGLRLGQRRAVVVSSPLLAKEILLTHDKVFSDRPSLDFTSLVFFGSTAGIAFSSHCPQWRLNRKLCMLHLLTSKRLQELQFIRHQEIRSLLLSIHDQSHGATPINLGTCVGRMSFLTMMRMLQSGATMQVGDENMPQLIKDTEQQALPTVGDLIPSLSFLDFFRKRRMRSVHARLDKVYTQMMVDYKESGSTNDGLLRSLLSQEEELTAVQIKSILHDVIGAGIHTTSLTLEWAMAELLRNPQCLQRLRSEIDTQLGEKKLVSDADLPSLPYLKCVVKESSRLHPVIPFLIPRISMEECEVQGYTIPARTLVFVNVWAIGRDEHVWPNANEFMPERFEGSDIDFKGQHFELLPFGSGRRNCAGLPLASSIVEVTLANLVSCFDWELPYGETMNMDERNGIAANKATPVIAIPKPRVSRSNLSNI